MTGKTFGKQQNNAAKTFRNTVKPSSVKALPFYIIDTLIAANTNGQAPLTVSELQQHIRTTYKICFDKTAICNTLSAAIQYFKHASLSVSIVRRGTSKPKAFTININDAVE